MGPKFLVAKKLLQRGLSVVKRAVHRKGEDIGRARAGHLALLQWRDAAVGIGDENGGARLPQQAVDGRRAGVAGGRAEDIDRLPAHAALALVEVAQ